MAFSINGWNLVGPQPNYVTLQDGTAYGSPSISTYISDQDTQATIAGANYFAPVVTNLKLGDFIYAIDSTNMPQQYYVTAVNQDAKTITVGMENPAGGDVIGTPPSTNNALARYSGVTGLLIKNSLGILSDAGALSGLTGLSVTGNIDALAASPVRFWNAGSTFYSAIIGGNNAGNVTYTLPTAAPAVNGQFLSGTTAGVLSWSAILDTAWIDQAATPVTMAVNTSYIADTGGLLTFNMPAVAAQGTVFKIAGKGAGGWLVQFAGGQTGHLNSSATSVAGSFASTNQWNCIEILCVTANTTFTVLSSEGAITVA